MAIKKIIVVCINPLTKRDFIRFGGEVLKENGFDVWFYDFSPFVYPKLFKNCTFPDLYRPENFILFSSESETSEAFTKLPPESFVIMDPQFDYRTFKIFQALSKTKIPYCAVNNHSGPEWKENKSLNFLKILKKIFSLNITNLKKIIYSHRFAHIWGIRPPSFCIAGSELSLKRNRSRFIIGENTETIWTHAHDYDTFLENKNTNEKVTGNHAVFLDPLAPIFQGDALAMDFKVATTVEKYYPSICKFFDYVEKKLDVIVKIAAHPKSNHPPCPEYFGGRQTLRGNTFGMIENSRFVMTHSSTSIQFSILLKKPILLLTTEELEKGMLFSAEIKAYAQSLGKKIINIDEPLNMDLGKEMCIDDKLYEDYIDLYIKKRGTEELNTWQILTNRINRL
jgi:hypothetical protein